MMAEHRGRKKFSTAWSHRNKRQRQTHQRPEEPPRWQDTVGLKKILAASEWHGPRLVEEENDGE